jgi:diacylglycerol kinase (ATP)
MAKKIRHVHVIINPFAGQDEPILKILSSVFGPARIKWTVLVTSGAGDARQFAKAAALAGVDAVVVYGGDGTVTEAASGLIGSRVPLAILPGGTANVTSVEMGIPTKTSEAAALLLDPTRTERVVDMGLVGGKYFLGHVGIGLEGDMHETADRSMKDRFGLFAYPIAALRRMVNRPVSHFTFTARGKKVEKVEMDAVNCMVTNLGSIGVLGATFAQGISVSDGLLDVMLIRNTDLTSLSELVGSVTGLGDPNKGLPHWQVRSIKITADPPQRITADGELLGTTPVTIKIVPSAIRIIVPAQAAAKAEQESQPA